VTLGIDVGLSGVRAAALDDRGRLLSAARRSLPARTAAGRAEQDSRAWLAALLETGREAAAGHDVDAVAVCALGPSPMLLNEELEPLTPALLFALDRRAAPGTLGVTHDHALPKLLWWREHEPALWERAAWAVDATGFLVAQLTGIPVLNTIAAADWQHPREPPPLPLPEAQDPFAIAGGMLEQPARALGLHAGTPVAVGTYDTYADVLAAGVREPGDACVLLGSTLVVCAAAPEPVDCPGLESTAYLGEGTLVGGWTASAGSSLDWFARELGPPGDVAPLEPGAGGLLALPYLAGERTPVWDPDARGVVLGLTLETRRDELYRALVDAVALSARDHLERLRGVRRVPDRWRARGGGANDEAWLRATCDALGAPLDVTAHPGEAVGPALLAHRAMGGDVSLPVARQVQPDPARAERYDRLYTVYRELHPATAPLVHRLVEAP
jgi:xylulokinase